MRDLTQSNTKWKDKQHHHKETENNHKEIMNYKEIQNNDNFIWALS